MRHDLPIDFFLDRLQDMPDIEAVQEIDRRLVYIEQLRRELGGEVTEAKQGAREILNSDETRLRSERHLFVARMERRKWRKAVHALWGDEGVEQCLIWFEARGEPDVKQIPLLRNGRKQ